MCPGVCLAANIGRDFSRFGPHISVSNCAIQKDGSTLPLLVRGKLLHDLAAWVTQQNNHQGGKSVHHM